MIKWAVSGSGGMASLFLNDCKSIDNGRFTAVYSHSNERAERFAAEHQLEKSFDDFDELLADPDIDAVYIASTHPNHAPQAIKALHAGKHVLIEKPMALTLGEAQAVFDAAAKAQKFCAEALWTKFSPTYATLMDQLKAGRIGEVRHIQANFGFPIDQQNTSHRLLNPEHAGGALLDIGLYTLFMPLTLFGVPQTSQASVTKGATGVDIASDVIMSWDDGRSAALSYRFDALMPKKAVISATEGWVELDSPFFAGNTLHWCEAGKPVVTEQVALTNTGWGNEFAAVNRQIMAGDTQAREHSREDSLMLAGYLESLRREYGPIYPFESSSS